MSPLPTIAVLAAFVFADEGDRLRIECGDCEQTEKISLPACLDGTKASPAAEVSGHRLTLDQDGRKTQVWIGLRDKGRSQQLYVAHRPDGAREWRCTAIADLDSFAASLAEPGANLSSVGLRSGAPGVNVSLFAQDSCTSQGQDRGIACPALGEGCEVAWQGPFWTSLRGQCDDDSDPKQKKIERQREAAERKTRARAEKLHAKGMAAFRRGDLTAAEQAWKAAAPDSVAAINDLGFLYHQQKRYPEAERALLQTLLRDGLRMPAWLNIADLYWDAGKKALARRAYVEYTRRAADENKKSAIPPRVLERSK